MNHIETVISLNIRTINEHPVCVLKGTTLTRFVIFFYYFELKPSSLVFTKIFLMTVMKHHRLLGSKSSQCLHKLVIKH